MLESIDDASEWSARGRTRELPQELEPRAGKHRRRLSLCRGHVAIGASVSGPFQEMTGERLFATLVIIAVVTTLMASPVFERLVGSNTAQQPVSGPETEKASELKLVR